MKTPTERVEQLLEEIRPHTQYWDCYNDVPLEEKHDVIVAELVISKQLELLRYLSTKTSEELYDDLVKQKVALKDNFN